MTTDPEDQLERLARIGAPKFMIRIFEREEGMMGEPPRTSYEYRVYRDLTPGEWLLSGAQRSRARAVEEARMKIQHTYGDVPIEVEGP